MGEIAKNRRVAPLGQMPGNMVFYKADAPMGHRRWPVRTVAILIYEKAHREDGLLKEIFGLLDYESSIKGLFLSICSMLSITSGVSFGRVSSAFRFS